MQSPGANRLPPTAALVVAKIFPGVLTVVFRARGGAGERWPWRTGAAALLIILSLTLVR